MNIYAYSDLDEHKKSYVDMKWPDANCDDGYHYIFGQGSPFRRVPNEVWTPFWFETNSAWGDVRSLDEWKHRLVDWFRGRSECCTQDVYDLCVQADPQIYILPNFGTRAEHFRHGGTTLRDFFVSNNMPIGD